MIRRVSIVGACLVAVGVLSGCSKNSTEAPATNQAPVAKPQVQAGTLCSSTPVALVTGGSDHDGRIVLNQWDFENDGTLDSSLSGGYVVYHSYRAGDHAARLVVTDDQGA